MERLGLVGLPNSGKSSLFNALTGGSVAVAAHPFSTTETTTGIAKVADHRLDALAELHHSRKVVHAGVEMTDIAGLAAGAAEGEGLGNRFLATIREVDALCLVLRAFDDEEVPGQSDPLESLGELELELTLADLASVEGLLQRRRKAARSGDATAAKEVEALDAALAPLGDGVPIYRSGLSEEQRVALKSAFLLTNKPVLAVVNLSEEQAGEGAAGSEGKLVAEVGEVLGGSAEALGLCVQLEAEAAQLDPGERSELLQGLGLGEGALARLARAAFDVLGRRTFFTTGDKESRAWTYRSGARAPECAGVIHSDLQRGFIRAEVIPWDELLSAGSWSAAKASGRLRIEGKDYQVADGDVLEIRFNV